MNGGQCPPYEWRSAHRRGLSLLDPSRVLTPGKGGTMRRVGMIVLLAGLAPAGSGRGELVYFSKGGRAQLAATTSGTNVRLETPDGPLEFDRSDFRKVVPGHWPEREWEARRAAAKAGGAEARYAAAWWALENGLTPQAVAMLRESHADDPAHEPTARMVAALDRLERPAERPDLGPLRKALQARFRGGGGSARRPAPPARRRPTWPGGSTSASGSSRAITCSSPRRGSTCRPRRRSWPRPGSPSNATTSRS